MNIAPQPSFHCRLSRTLKVESQELNVNESPIVNLVASSNKYGLIFVAYGDRKFYVYRLDDVLSCQPEGVEVGLRQPEAVDCSRLAVECSSNSETDVISGLALSANDAVLAVFTTQPNTSTMVWLYDIRVFSEFQQGAKNCDGSSIGPFYSVRASALEEAHVVDFAWCPVGLSFACVLSNGFVSSFELKLEGEVSIDVVGLLPANTGATCLAWSPKGKQIVIGKKDGTLCQYKPDLQPAKNIPAPTCFENPVAVLQVSWLVSNVFGVVYLLEGEWNFVLVTLNKGQPPAFVNYSELCMKTGSFRREQVFMQQIIGWRLLYVLSLNSVETAVIAGRSGSATDFELWDVDSERRAELPLKGHDETYPVGATVSLCSQRNIQGKNEAFPPMPVLLVLSNQGILCPYFCINTAPDAPSIVQPPSVLSSDGCLKGIPPPKRLAAKHDEKPAETPTTTTVVPPVVTPLSGTPATAATVSSPFGSAFSQPSQRPGGSISFGTPVSKPATTVATVSKPSATTGGTMFSTPAKIDQATPITSVSTPVKPVIPSTPETSAPKAQQPQQQVVSESTFTTEQKEIFNEEIRQFSMDLATFKADAASVRKEEIGTDQERQFFRDRVAAHQDKLSRLSTRIINIGAEIQELRLVCIEALGTIDDAKSRQAQANDPKYRTLYQQRRLDPTTAARLTEVRNYFNYVDKQLREIHHKIDTEYVDAMSPRNKLPAPEMLYRTFGNCERTLAVLRKSVEKIHREWDMIKKIRERPMLAKSFNGTSMANVTDSMLAFHLNDSINETSLKNTMDESKPRFQLSPKKLTSLATYFQTRSPDIVLPKKLQSLEQSRLVSKMPLFKEKVSGLSSKKEPESAALPSTLVISGKTVFLEAITPPELPSPTNNYQTTADDPSVNAIAVSREQDKFLPPGTSHGSSKHSISSSGFSAVPTTFSQSAFTKSKPTIASPAVSSISPAVASSTATIASPRSFTFSAAPISMPSFNVPSNTSSSAFTQPKTTASSMSFSTSAFSGFGTSSTASSFGAPPTATDIQSKPTFSSTTSASLLTTSITQPSSIFSLARKENEPQAAGFSATPTMFAASPQTTNKPLAMVTTLAPNTQVSKPQVSIASEQMFSFRSENEPVFTSTPSKPEAVKTTVTGAKSNDEKSGMNVAKFEEKPPQNKSIFGQPAAAVVTKSQSIFGKDLTNTGTTSFGSTSVQEKSFEVVSEKKATDERKSHVSQSQKPDENVESSSIVGQKQPDHEVKSSLIGSLSSGANVTTTESKQSSIFGGAVQSSIFGAKASTTKPLSIFSTSTTQPETSSVTTQATSIFGVKSPEQQKSSFFGGLSSTAVTSSSLFGAKPTESGPATSTNEASTFGSKPELSISAASTAVSATLFSPVSVVASNLSSSEVSKPDKPKDGSHETETKTTPTTAADAEGLKNDGDAQNATFTFKLPSRTTKLTSPTVTQEQPSSGEAISTTQAQGAKSAAEFSFLLPQTTEPTSTATTTTPVSPFGVTALQSPGTTLQPSTQSTSIFSSTAPSIFGQASSPVSTTTATTSPFGGGSANLKPSIFGGATSPQPLSSFGAAASPTPAAPSTVFGATTATKPSIFGQPSTGGGIFGSNAAAVVATTTTAVTTNSSPFKTANSGGSLFGGTQSPSGTFSSPTAGASPSLYGGSRAFGEKPAFGQQQQQSPAFGQSPPSAFGAPVESGGFMSGLGAKAVTTNAPNVFGGATSFSANPSTSSLFGGTTGGGLFGSQQPSTFGGQVDPNNAFQTPKKSDSIFGGSPVFGASTPPQPAFGSSPTFGSSPQTFGGSPAFGSPAGFGTAAPSFGGAPTFGSLAATTPATGSMFGNTPEQPFGSASPQQSSFGFGALAQAATPFGEPPKSSASFSQWRG